MEVAITNPNAAQHAVLLVFVHGNGLTKSTFRSTIAKLFELHNESQSKKLALHCLSLDLPGHGTSPYAGQTLDRFTKLSDFAVPLVDQVQSYVKQCKVKFTSKILVAHSVGCHIALFAHKSIGFDKAILIEPIIDERRPAEAGGEPQNNDMMIERSKARRRKFPSFQAAFDALRPKGMFATWETEAVENYVFHGGLRVTDDGQVELNCLPELEAKIFGIDKTEIEPELKSFRFQTCIVVAGEDTYIPHDLLRSTANKLNADFLLLPQVGHVLMCENASILAELVSSRMLSQQAKI